MFDEPVYATRIERIQAPQGHPVPDKVKAPSGPFPRELFAEPEIITSTEVREHLPGATAQNDFKPPRYLRCAMCHERVLETETSDHKCGE